MLFAYRPDQGHLTRLKPQADLSTAQWIDLYRPFCSQSDEVARLGLMPPTLAYVDEVEISNRLYRAGGADCMMVVLPGLSQTKTPTSGAVCFVLTRERLVTLRHKAPRLFEPYPERADTVGRGCDTPEKGFLGLIEEIIGRMADVLEGIGRGLDDVASGICQGGTKGLRAELSQTALDRGPRRRSFGPGSVGPVDRRTRGQLLWPNACRPPGCRMAAFGQRTDAQSSGADGECGLSGRAPFPDFGCHAGHDQPVAKRHGKDRVGGGRPIPAPHLDCQRYGMTFANMPELAHPLGHPKALAMMLASGVGTCLFFKWKRWL